MLQRDDIDVVFITTPTVFHGPMGAASLVVVLDAVDGAEVRFRRLVLVRGRHPAGRATLAASDLPLGTHRIVASLRPSKSRTNLLRWLFSPTSSARRQARKRY